MESVKFFRFDPRGTLVLVGSLNPERDPLQLSTLSQAAYDLAQIIQTQAWARVLVAVSGGADSMLLASLLATAAVDSAFRLEVLHVNYGLRGADADADAEFVRAWANARQLSYQQWGPGALGPRRSGEGTQEWARRERYAFFRSQRSPDAVVALGHHLDDQAETVLLRLSRGSSPGKLLGMEPLRDGIWRPLLGLSKAALGTFAARQNIPHRHDLSNDTLIYSRNRVRHIVLPELEQLHHGVAAKIVAMAREARDMQRWSEEVLLGQLPKGSIMTRADLNCFPSRLALQAVALFLEREGARGLSRRILYTALDRMSGVGARPWQEQFPAGAGALRVSAAGLQYLPAAAPPDCS